VTRHRRISIANAVEAIEQNRARFGDIHRDPDATIVIRVEPTLPLNPSSKAPR
jgi:hypothetical protein